MNKDRDRKKAHWTIRKNLTNTARKIVVQEPKKKQRTAQPQIHQVTDTIEQQKYRSRFVNQARYTNKFNLRILTFVIIYYYSYVILLCERERKKIFAKNNKNMILVRFWDCLSAKILYMCMLINHILLFVSTHFSLIFFKPNCCKFVLFFGWLVGSLRLLVYMYNECICFALFSNMNAIWKMKNILTSSKHSHKLCQIIKKWHFRTKSRRKKRHTHTRIYL